MKLLRTTAIIVLTGLGAGAQDLPSEIVRDPNGNTATYGIRVLGPNDAVNLPAQILDIQINPDGADVFFAGEEDRSYALWASTGDQLWQEVAIAGSVAPGMYLALDESALQIDSRLYMVVELGDERPFDPLLFAEQLSGMVQMQGELTPQQREAFAGAVAAFTQAKAALVQACNEVTRLKKCVADCLAEVMRLRIAAQQAEAEAKGAEAEVERLRAPLEAIDDQLADLAAQRRALQKRINDLVTQWAHTGEVKAGLEAELRDTSDPGARADLQSRITSLRSQMDNWIAEHNRLQDELKAVKKKEADLRAEGEAMLPALEAAEKEARDKRAAAEAAAEAYRKAKEECDRKKEALQEAEDRKQQAAGQAQQASDDFENARTDAAQQVDENRAAREAAAAEAATEAERQAAAEAEARMQAAQEKARRELAQSLQAWKCFFDFIRETAGEEEAVRVADSIGGAWGNSLGAFKILKGIFKGLARGQSIRSMIGGAAMSGMQVGYGVLVSYAKAKIVNAVKNILGGTTARWIKELQDDMKPGESRVVKFKNSVHVLVKTAQGQVYVFSWTKNYFTSGGTYREDVFID